MTRWSGIAGCDKSLPGMMMAMCRLNVPSIFIYGGSILPGTFKGKPVTVQDVFEAVGRHSVGEMRDGDLETLEQNACPSAGACGAQFTANTMATVSEAIGLALPYSAGAPAPYEFRDRFCMAAGEQVIDLIRRNLRPRDIVTRKALENAAAVVAASGGSTNAALHLPAIAHECGIEFDLFDVAEVFKRTPYIADLKPGGRYVAKDLFEAGGVPLLMKTLLDHGFMHGDCMTVTGRTHGRKPETRGVESRAGRRSPGRSTADRQRAGSSGCGAISPPRARSSRLPAWQALKFSGPARCFDGEEACFEAVKTAQIPGRRRSRHPLRGAEGRPRHARNAGDHGGALRPGHGRQGGARSPMAGFPGATRGFCVGHVGPEAAIGGPIALLRDGDIISSMRTSGSWRFASARPNSNARRAAWQPREGAFASGYLWKYAQQVGPARLRRRHPSRRGGREEVLCGYLSVFCSLPCSAWASAWRRRSPSTERGRRPMSRRPLGSKPHRAMARPAEALCALPIRRRR